MSNTPVSFECSARKQSLPEPADCDWPFCGCDPYADKVIAALQECGWTASQPIGYVGAVKIVPVEPTAAMIDAANESEASWKSIWPAMLSASPAPLGDRDALIERLREENADLHRLAFTDAAKDAYHIADAMIERKYETDPTHDDVEGR